jgi:hypothetical protein
MIAVGQYYGKRYIVLEECPNPYLFRNLYDIRLILSSDSNGLITNLIGNCETAS